MKINLKRIIVFLLLAAVLTAADQWTKSLAVQHLKNTDGIVLVRNVLYLIYIENRGAAFGAFQGMQIMFYLITAAVLCGIVYLLCRIPEERRYNPMLLVCLLVFSGAVGNFIDRVKQSYVVDFIYFSPIDFPVFNVADIYVTCGCFLMVLLFLMYYKEDDFLFLNKKQNTP